MRPRIVDVIETTRARGQFAPTKKCSFEHTFAFANINMKPQDSHVFSFQSISGKLPPKLVAKDICFILPPSTLAASGYVHWFARSIVSMLHVGIMIIRVHVTLRQILILLPNILINV